MHVKTLQSVRFILCYINVLIIIIINPQVFQINLNHSLPNICSDNMDDITFFKSTKVKKKVAYKGYVYKLYKEKGQTGHWKCENREDCRGRLTLINGIGTKEKSHSYAPDTAADKIQRSLSAMKESVKNSRECTSAIINRHISY